MSHDDFESLVIYLGCGFLLGSEFSDRCAHPENFDFSCSFELCPLKSIWLDAKKVFDEYDPFYREEDYE